MHKRRGYGGTTTVDMVVSRFPEGMEEVSLQFKAEHGRGSACNFVVERGVAHLDNASLAARMMCSTWRLIRGCNLHTNALVRDRCWSPVPSTTDRIGLIRRIAAPRSQI